MTKPKPRPERPIDAVRIAVNRESKKRDGDLKPIEIVKVALCAYQDHVNAIAPEKARAVESADKSGLRRGTQAAVDRLLFNANYWLSAYENRIVDACAATVATPLLNAVTVWGTHTLKLNTLSNDEAVATFERFCPPFATNNRKGASGGKGRARSRSS